MPWDFPIALHVEGTQVLQSVVAMYQSKINECLMPGIEKVRNTPKKVHVSNLPHTLCSLHEGGAGKRLFLQPGVGTPSSHHLFSLI